TECNCLALRQAARHASQIYDAHLAETGLKTTQYSILAKLNRLGPLSINELAQVMVLDRTTLSRAIRPLQREKLLAIGADEDGRKRKLSLTDSGRARFKLAMEQWRKAQSEFELAFGVPDSAGMRDVLRRVVAVT